MKCELVKVNPEDEEDDFIASGIIEGDPTEQQVIIYEGEAYIYKDTETDDESNDIAVYTLTGMAEFTEETEDDQAAPQAEP